MLLSMLAALSIDFSRSERDSAAHMYSRAQVNAALEAGLTLGIAALLTPTDEDFADWPTNGSVLQTEHAGQGLNLSVQDVFGQFDLNGAPVSAFATFFTSLGFVDPRPGALADAIGDWRDADSLERLNGAEKDDYERINARILPRNAAFESVSELEQVLGFDREVVRQAEAFLTVYSRKPQVDPSTLPLKSSERSNGRAFDVPVSSGEQAARRISDLLELRGRAFVVGATIAGKPHRSLSATIRLRQDKMNPILLHTWR